ncbi:MAG: hypothetical protein F6K26_03880 [Moorea sp. SIO2I5]|nr:hypothetical protein [Moorena sp. SIO2I5]
MPFPCLDQAGCHPAPIQVLFFKLVTGHENHRRFTSTYRTRLCSVDRIPTVELVPIAVNFQLPVIFANKIKSNKK